MAIKLQPLADRVVVKPIEREEISKGGIVIPDTAKERPQEGEIIAVAAPKMHEDGKRIARDVKVRRHRYLCQVRRNRDQA